MLKQVVGRTVLVSAKGSTPNKNIVRVVSEKNTTHTRMRFQEKDVSEEYVSPVPNSQAEG